MLVSDSLTNSCLVNLIDVTMACEDANSKLVEVVILLLMFMMRIMLARVCCRFGSSGLVIKLKFCSDFEHRVSGQDFEVEVQARF